MPISKQQKEEVIKQLSSDLGKAKSVVLSVYSKLTVNDDHGLRADLREAKVDYKVVKKTLLKRALADAKLESIDLNNVRGNVAVATSGDEISAAKVLQKFSKGNENLSIIAGYLESIPIDISKIMELALLPSKEEMIAKTLATINAPIQNFVGVLAGTTRNLLYALNAIKESKS
jgi:large subunit ribosomal protein L10